MITSLAHLRISSSAEDCVELNSARKKKDPRASRHQDTYDQKWEILFPWLHYDARHEDVQLHNEANKASECLLYRL